MLDLNQRPLLVREARWVAGYGWGLRIWLTLAEVVSPGSSVLRAVAASVM
jgi:hypothetical protein